MNYFLLKKSFVPNNTLVSVMFRGVYDSTVAYRTHITRTNLFSNRTHITRTSLLCNKYFINKCNNLIEIDIQQRPTKIPGHSWFLCWVCNGYEAICLFIGSCLLFVIVLNNISLSAERMNSNSYSKMDNSLNCGRILQQITCSTQRLLQVIFI